ncbi:hypothetical protein B4N89_45120 [Embleya scabrispora]|uniref:Uncharacterized protein n=1 Tax=Embleya scabrispora TaxID=159449 RepID=A0A1T3NIP0_9ACTN|nr:hypothetical protein B4N89_45120 [Embleya scabrispora]
MPTPEMTTTTTICMNHGRPLALNTAPWSATAPPSPMPTPICFVAHPTYNSRYRNPICLPRPGMHPMRRKGGAIIVNSNRPMVNIR